MIKLIIATFLIFTISGNVFSDSNKLMIDDLKKIENFKEGDLYNIFLELDRATSLLNKTGNSSLLEEIIKLYGRIADVDENHFCYEYIIPYYKLHKTEVMDLVKKLLTPHKQKIFDQNIRFELKDGHG